MGRSELRLYALVGIRRAGRDHTVQHSSAKTPHVKTKVALIHPDTLNVVWMNEAAAEGLGSRSIGQPGGAPLERVVPMAEGLGIREALQQVIATGEPQHVRADIISTAKGSVAIIGSFYRLPDGMLLMVTEHAWQAGRDRAEEADRRPGRRRR